MWNILLWVLGLGTAFFSGMFAFMIVKRKHIKRKSVLLAKYVFIAFVPLTWGVGTCVAQSDAGREKSACLGMLLLLFAAVAAILGDIGKKGSE